LSAQRTDEVWQVKAACRGPQAAVFFPPSHFERKEEKLERELAVARGIQQSMVPRKLPHLPGFDFGAQMMPARAVGGDFFDFVPLRDGTLGIVIGDVAVPRRPASKQ